MEKSINKRKKNFYPVWREYLAEEYSVKGKSNRIPFPKIDDMDKVYTINGEEIDMKHLKREMESAKTAIVSQSPLFAPYVHNFTPIYTWYVPTMATDGIRLFVNPKFANDLTWEQKIFVIIHEIMHCVLLHMERIKGRDPELYNMAADLEINPIIIDTLNDFDEAFIRDLNGLYDKKYLNQPVEAIYEDLKKNPPMAGNSFQDNKGGKEGESGKSGESGDSGQPGKGGKKGKGGGVEIEVGTKVMIRSTGEKGIVTAINPDGTYEVDIINESFYPKLSNILFESYRREELVPIIEGEPPADATKNSSGGVSDPAYEVIYEKMREYDPAGTGGIMTKDIGEKIAEKSGYDVESGEAGPDIDPKDKWTSESAKMLKDIERSKEYGSGKGRALLTALSRLHRGEVNWKNLFSRFVSTALSPEVYQKIGNKKHLGKEYLKYGEKNKMDALENIVILVDVSGSMSMESLERILGEINSIIFSKRVKTINIAFFDDGVDEESVQRITRTSGRPWIPKNVKGGGGTDFQKALDWVKEKFRDRISLLVFFTDGYAPMPEKPIYWNKFIWVVYGNPTFKQPFGKLVNLS